jgi:hypothetical protein
VRLIDADALLKRKGCVYDSEGHVLFAVGTGDIVHAPTIDAIPVEWLNERHRKCCEEGDTDLMDAITVLCNEYHVWQKEQEAQDG